MVLSEGDAALPAVGITGGIACGKSEVAKVLADEGVAVIDADDVAHEVMAPGTPHYEAIVKRFGRGVLDRDGGIDRAVLGELVFDDAGARRELEKMVHPEVIRRLRGWLDGVREDRQRSAAAVIPLLFEVGAEGFVDAVVCVSADERHVLARLLRRGLDERQARLRMEAQMPLEEKEQRSDYVIRNNGTLAALAEDTKRTWQALLRKERP